MKIVFETKTFERLRPFHFRTTHDKSILLCSNTIGKHQSGNVGVSDSHTVLQIVAACEMAHELFISFAI